MDAVKEGRQNKGGRPRSRNLSPLGLALQILMDRKGLNVNQVAERSGVSPHAIYSIMDGCTREPRVSTLRKLAEHLGTTKARLERHLP